MLEMDIKGVVSLVNIFCYV